MGWKIRPSGHDPRQLDLLAIVAIVVIVIAVGHFLIQPAKRSGIGSFFEPSQTVRW
jgi:preprotein translocase subunit SecG